METNNTTMTTTDLGDILEVNETITATIKTNAMLKAKASNDEILHALDDVCSAWRDNFATGEKLKLLVGRILAAVKARQIFKDPKWGTFEVFLQTEVCDKYNISRTVALDAVAIVETLPDVGVEEAEKIGSSNLLTVARAVKRAPEEKRDVLTRRLLKKAVGMPVKEFKEHALGRSNSDGEPKDITVPIIIRVHPDIAALWHELIDGSSPADVFAKLVQAAMGRMERRKSKQPKGKPKVMAA